MTLGFTVDFFPSCNLSLKNKQGYGSEFFLSASGKKYQSGFSSGCGSKMIFLKILPAQSIESTTTLFTGSVAGSENWYVNNIFF